jgi:hypothetical protein
MLLSNILPALALAGTIIAAPYVPLIRHTHPSSFHPLANY